MLLRLLSQHRGEKTENCFKNPENYNSYLEKKLLWNTAEMGGGGAGTENNIETGDPEIPTRRLGDL